MNLRIQADELPDSVLQALGGIANKGRLQVGNVMWSPEERLVTFIFNRFPIAGKSVFTHPVHSESSIPCHATIRNVTGIKIEDTGQCEEITILFGLDFKKNEISLSSAEESRGVTCYQLSCSISGIDIEMIDE